MSAQILISQAELSYEEEKFSFFFLGGTLQADQMPGKKPSLPPHLYLPEVLGLHCKLKTDNPGCILKIDFMKLGYPIFVKGRYAWVRKGSIQSCTLKH